MIALSDIGNVRKNNEDTFLITESEQFAIVCDGMGGHQAGQEASRLACETIHDLTLANGNELIAELVQTVTQDLPARAAQMVAAIRMANSRVFQEAQKKPELKGMGTTATAILFDDGQVMVAHVGDSRAYRLRNGDIQRLTEDHTWLNELIQDNEIEAAEADAFERKNVITRAIGLGPAIKVDVTTDIARAGDLYLLCSDGLTDSLKDDLIQQIIGMDGDIELSTACLIAKAKELKGNDNITAVLVKVIASDEVNPNLGLRKVIVPEQDEKLTLKESKFIKQLYNGKRIVNEKGQIIITVQKDKKRSLFEIVGSTILLILVVFFAIQAQQARQAVRASNLKSTELSDDSMLAAEMEFGIVDDMSVNANKGVVAVLYFENLPSYRKYTFKLRSTVLDTLMVVPSVFNNRKSIDLWVRDANNRTLYKNIKGSHNPALMHLATDNRSANNPITTPQRRNSGKLTPGPNNGIIYLAGFENSRKYHETWLYLNDRQVGKLDDFLASGIRVLPGTYTISIQDTSGKIIQQKEEITILAGDIKILEAD